MSHQVAHAWCFIHDSKRSWMQHVQSSQSQSSKGFVVGSLNRW